jgi:predicted permease
MEWSAVDVWVPFSTSALAMRPVVAFPIILRLGAGISEAEVTARASLAYARVYADSGTVTEGRSVLLGGLSEARAPISGQQEVMIATRLAIVAGIVLLIACANITNLMLSRLMRRRRELAVRLALGISRRRMALQLLIETLAISLIAAVAALFVGTWLGSALRTALLPRVEWIDPAVDARIVFFVFALTVLAALVAAVIPASLTGRLELTADLASGRHGAAPPRSVVRQGLIVLQTALAMMLLVGTALFARSLGALHRVDTGLDLEKLVIASAYFPDEQRHLERGSVFPDVAQRLEMHPAVAAAAWGSTAPLYSWYSFASLFERGRESALTTEVTPTDYAAISSRFFEVTGTRILSGRGFHATDTRAAPWIMVVGESMAKRFWPNENPLGKCVSLRTREAQCHTIVGIAQDIHAFRRIEDAANRFYIPFSQSPNERSLPSVLILRTSAGSDPAVVAGMAAAELRRFLPGATITSRDALSILEPELRPWRLGAQLFGALGLLALLVAAVGLYSVVSFDTRQRTRELGIRKALGASSKTLLRTALGSVVRVTAIGIAVGVVGALIGGRFVTALVYGVSPRDTTSMVFAGLTLMAVAVLASLAPAIRSARVDPVIAMRAD